MSDPADKPRARPTFLIRHAGNYQVDATIPAFQWKQMPEQAKAEHIANMQGKMLLHLRGRLPGKFFDFPGVMIGDGQGNGALTIGQGKLIQRALPVRFVAAIYDATVVQPAGEPRTVLAQLAEQVLGPEAGQAWLAALDRIVAAWPEEQPVMAPQPVPAGAH